MDGWGYSYIQLTNYSTCIELHHFHKHLLSFCHSQIYLLLWFVFFIMYKSMCSIQIHCCGCTTFLTWENNPFVQTNNNWDKQNNLTGVHVFTFYEPLSKASLLTAALTHYLSPQLGAIGCNLPIHNSWLKHSQKIKTACVYIFSLPSRFPPSNSYPSIIYSLAIIYSNAYPHPLAIGFSLLFSSIM